MLKRNTVLAGILTASLLLPTFNGSAEAKVFNDT